MKSKILIIPIIIILIFSILIGCSKSSPEDVISQYSNYFKSGQFDKMYDLLSEKSKGAQTKEEFAENLGTDPSDDESTKLIIKQMMDSFEFEPIGSTIDGNEAYVETRITMPDFGKLFLDLLSELFELAFTSENFDEEANDLLVDYLKENELETVKVYKDIRLVYEDSWKIDTSSFELFEVPDLTDEKTVKPSESESVDSQEQTPETEDSYADDNDDISIEEPIEEEVSTTSIEPLLFGDIVSVTNWDYKVNEAKAMETIGEYSARGIYIVALVEVTNTSNSAKDVGTGLFEAVDEQGRIYEMDSTVSLEYYHENNLGLWHYDELGPSLTDVLPVVFDVPKDASNVVLVTAGDSNNPILLMEESGFEIDQNETTEVYDIVSVTNWDYKVNEAKAMETIGEYSARGIYIVALVEVTNTSNSAKDVGTGLFEAVDEQGRIYEMDSTVSLEYYHENNLGLWHYDELGPSLTDVLPVVFDVPKDASNVVLVTVGDSNNPILLIEELY